MRLVRVVELHLRQCDLRLMKGSTDSSNHAAVTPRQLTIRLLDAIRRDLAYRLGERIARPARPRGKPNRLGAVPLRECCELCPVRQEGWLRRKRLKALPLQDDGVETACFKLGARARGEPVVREGGARREHRFHFERSPPRPRESLHDAREVAKLRVAVANEQHA
jgi:hypothetical protein